MLRTLCSLVPCAALAACVVEPEPNDPPVDEPAANTTSNYIVVLSDAPRNARKRIETTHEATDRLAAAHRATIGHRYATALHGFSAAMTEQDARALAADPSVALVERDAIVHASVIQNNATFGLDRIDQRALPLNGSYAQDGQGEGSTVFVIDTGIRGDHSEFTGRVLPGATAIDDGHGTEDCNGHGTHVSGTVAGTNFGVAKLAKLVPIRVLDCSGSGSVSGVIAGIDFVAENHPPQSVANLSLGGGASDALDASIRNAVSSGVTVVVAAGNESQSACNVSPAREATAITVGATTSSDARASFSNFGSCVDLFAPGVGIKSAWIDSATATNTISGTSMASPHVAGAAALFLAENPAATPADVAAGLVTAATANALSNVSGSPNLLLYTVFESPPPAPPPPPPPPQSVELSSPANGAEVDASFTVTANASDGFVSLALAVDGVTRETKTSGSSPFTFAVSNLAPGTHAIEITLVEGSGDVLHDTLEVVVRAPAGGGGGDNAGGGGGADDGGGGGNTNDSPPVQDDPLAGCSAGGSGSGLAVVALMLASIRRRRRS